ncbi:uncharacterized protein LOC121916539 [Sceloporus undulatus]|uniref:uncharacterized protein LOC121916539 n=1 Tax=Sceloporus undulatus TaxID=8520 RepID=UPI001C4D1421|nr:uncharacterized protein LOC121916539 [Sceloporus undulatus]
MGTTAPQASSGMVPLRFQPIDRLTKQVAHYTEGRDFLPPMVARLPKRVHRYALRPASTTNDSDDGCVDGRLGCTPSGPMRKREVVPAGTCAPHQRAGNVGGREGSESIRIHRFRQGDSTQDRQHNCDVLCQQTGRHQIQNSLRHHVKDLGLVHPQVHSPSGDSPTRRRKHPSGSAQQDINLPRVEASSRDSRPVCDSLQQPLSPVLFSGATRESSRRCICLRLVPGNDLCLSPVSTADQGGVQDVQGESRRDPHHPVVAETAVVSAASTPFQRRVSPAGTEAGPSHPPRGEGSASRHRLVADGGLEAPALTALTPSVRRVIRAAHRPATQRSYASKWKRFLSFLAERSLSPESITVPVVLDFLMSLVDAGLCLASIKCYLSAICSHFQYDGLPSFFRDPLVKNFLKGCNNLYSQVSLPAPAWSLEVVLAALQSKPFEPLATTDLRLLTWKTVFLVAITSARRAGELCALRRDEPFLRFHKDKVVLRTDITFLPKVVSLFHMCQDIVLPTLASNPSTMEERSLHMLDVRRALAFYLDRTMGSSRSERLFQCYSEPRKGLPVSPQRLSKWVASTIRLCYELSGKPVPAKVRSHATRAVAASSAFLAGIPLDDVCKAAVWSQPLTFIKHCRLDTRAIRDAAFGRAVLVSGLH